MELAKNFLSAIELEKKSEIEAVDKVLSQHSPKRIAKEGLAIVNLEISNIKTGLGGRIVIELEPDRAINAGEIDAGTVRVGDIVKVAPMAKETDSVEGVVIKLGLKNVSVAVEEDDDFGFVALENKRCWIAKITNNATYKRMETTMRKLGALSSHSPLVQLLLGESPYKSYGKEAKNITFFNDKLNESQKSAILYALHAPLSIIHGPPGTGKTYTIVELVQQLLANGHKRILVCGPSNIAVDTIVERLDGVIPRRRLLRVGHPARILPSVQAHALDHLVRTGDGAAIVDDVRKDLMKTLFKAKNTKRSQERRALWKEVKILKKEMRSRDAKLVSELVLQAQVVVGTLHGVGGRELDVENGGVLFDAMIVDEVSQALEPQVWVPILAHEGIKKLVLVGDNKQLPPTVKMDIHEDHKKMKNYKEIAEAKKLLETTLFDRLVDLHKSPELTQLLSVQYRMNTKIMEYSSMALYENRLVAAESVKDRILSDIASSSDDTEVPVIWIDTQGGDFPEQDEENQGKSNPREAELCLSHIESLVASGVSEDFVGVISPYRAQVSLLRQIIHPEFPSVEISTVDGFQGREKEAIILSLVRSNDNGSVGFLADKRRINVAITRPKRQLCVVGDMETVQRDDFMKNWVLWAEDNAEIRYP